jgi:hypothetical protein
LFVTTTRKKAIEFLSIGNIRYVPFVGRKVILRKLFGRSKPHAISLNDFRGNNRKKTSPIQKQIHRHMEKNKMPSILCSSRNFFHHYNINGHWEAKSWMLHSELHPRNYTSKRRVWRINIKGNEEIPSFPTQGEKIVKRCTT